MPEVRLRRVYDQPEAADGLRVLVDGLWPRGMTKDEAQLDRWARDVAPSRELRRWFGHDPDRFEEFVELYRSELDEDEREEILDDLADVAEEGPLTLLTATRDVDHSHARVLAEELRRR